MFMFYSDIRIFVWLFSRSALASRRGASGELLGTFWCPKHKVYVYVLFGYSDIILAVLLRRIFHFPKDYIGFCRFEVPKCQNFPARSARRRG